MNAAQQKEVDKYIGIYGKHKKYHMSGLRGQQAAIDLSLTVPRGSYLDVGCGRGEMLDYAKNTLGFCEVKGTETVPELFVPDNIEFALATDLPFKAFAFDVVSCLDVLEHLLPEDTEAALQELSRVAKKVLLLTANNNTSNSLGPELHINRRPYHEWDRLIRAHCDGKVQWIQRHNPVSETWMVHYD